MVAAFSYQSKCKKSYMLPKRMLRFHTKKNMRIYALTGILPRAAVMLKRNNINTRIVIAVWLYGLVSIAFAGCARLRIPQIDPTGNRIFLPAPNTTAVLAPNLVRNAERNPASAGVPVQPAFMRALEPVSCCGESRTSNGTGRRHVIPKPSRYPTRGQMGEIILTPSKIIAPVGSEVVVMAGICGGDSYYVINQPLEWLLSSDSAGQFIEVGGMEHPRFNRLVQPSAKKFDGNYAWGRTGLKNKLLTRGTPTPVDDIELGKGQAYVSLSSASEGTSYVTCVAPKAQAWDKRRKSTIIHWVDAVWSIPVPKTATAGTVTPLTTLVSRNTDSGGVADWKVRYTIVGGAPAEFAPTGSQTVEATTDASGQATVQMRQLAGQFDPGTTQVRVDVIRPRIFGEAELAVESGVTEVTWSAPALTIRAIGPRTAGINEAFSYRVEVSNPGDQVSRDVVLQTNDFPDTLEFVSSTPKPTVFGSQLKWELGDIQPGSQPQVVDIQLKSNTKGNNELCFDVSSQSDQLQTEACAQTEITVPCIGLQIDGPDAGKVGDQVKFNIVVANQCDEPLENVQLQIQYDPGLVATGLGNPIQQNIGTLEPGEKRALPVIFDVQSAGRHCYTLNITADGGHSARANECVDAAPTTAAAVNLEMEGARRVDRGDEVLIRATATNNGNVPLNNVTMSNQFSPTLEPGRVTQEFPHRWLGPEGDELIFDLGRLDPGQSKVVEIFYSALREDGDAFSQMTISSPDLSPIVRKYDLRVEIPGTVGDGSEGGIQPGGVEPGNQPGFSNPSPSEGANEGPIGIPNDDRVNDLNSRRDLQVTGQAVDRQVRAGQSVEIEFTIENNSSVSDKNVNMFLLVPPGLQYESTVDDLGNPFEPISRSGDFTTFEYEPRREMRPGDTFKLTARVRAVQPGQAFVEMQVSSDNSAGTVTSGDTVLVSQ